MTVEKQFLHELLKEDQEPFHLKAYLANWRSHPISTQRQKPSPFIHETTNLFSSAIGKSPAMSPCRSPNLLHIPSETAALLAKAAMRIQKQQQPKTGSHGFRMFGSFLKKLKDRAIGDARVRVSGKKGNKIEEKLGRQRVRISCSDTGGDWTESGGVSTSSSRSECSEEIHGETGFYLSPFIFSGCRPPDFCSSTKNQEKENSRKSDNVRGGGEELKEKEQCSPVSVLELPFEDEEDHHLEYSYTNVQTMFL